MIHFNLVSVLQTAGYLGLFAMVFAESGFFLGVFLPGDSLLFTAGILASSSYFSMWLIIPIALVAAILGDSFGYYFGSKTKKYLFVREDSLIFSTKNLDKSKQFYLHHGHKALILARFIPIIRTFVPVLAGASDMDYRKFLIYNITGGVLWVFSITLLGFFLGNVIPNIDHYLLPIILGIIVISFIPIVIKFIKEKFIK
jgi:membrane-associated protein